jgi:hypothetical protein
MGFGHVEGVNHDYVRHGTTTLFAALDAPTDSRLREFESAIGTRSSWTSGAKSASKHRPIWTFT